MKTLLALAALAVLAGPLAGSDARAAKNKPKRPRPTTSKPKRPRKPNSAMAKIEDTPGLPRVLLIGDSISVGYTLPARQLLKGKVNLHRIPTNGGPTTKGLAGLAQWLGKKKWDVIHFNWGLHDLKYMGPKGQNLAKPQAADSKQQVPPEEYEKNLRQLVKQLKATGAKLIWAATTPTPEGAAGRVKGDSAKYNAIAKKVMAANDIAIDDLYSPAMGQLKKIQQPKNVHFTPEGSKVLARQVADSILKALGLPELPKPKDTDEKRKKET